jgi:hypothetical protein
MRVQSVAAAVDWLARRPRVTWVTLHPKMQPHNLLAAAIMQSGSKLRTSVAPSNITQGTDSGFLPYWKVGLDGKGQVSARLLLVLL